jgi:hypothetical protein
MQRLKLALRLMILVHHGQALANGSGRRSCINRIVHPDGMLVPAALCEPYTVYS